MGVADVATTIDSIKATFTNDPTSLDKLNKSLTQPDANPYQNAFEYILGVRGIRYANEIIRKSVLNARTSNTPIQHGAEIADTEWHLPPAVDALGKILTKNPGLFGNRVLTTNFDPLIEAAIRRSGGSCYSTFFHRDGNPSTINADGVNVIHLHGFWQGSDTLHTPHQLKQNRPQLKSYILDLFRKSLVVVIAYGGWDDVVGSAIEDVVLEDNSDPELLWAFKSSELSHLELSEPKLLSRLRPGLDRGRVQLYGGVDCHELFPMLYAEMSIEPSSGDKQGEKIAHQPRILSDQEKILASVVGMQTERHVDTTPRIDGFVGREVELSALTSADASVMCISGFGGQGKSILAAKFLSTFDDNTIRDWRDCREEGNTAHTALALFLERLSNGSILAESLMSASHRELVDLIIQYGSNQDSVLVLDNVDTYVDLDQQRPIGVIGALCDRILEAKTRIRVLLTCRPFVQIPHSQFFGLPLTGLSEEAAKILFCNKSAGYMLSDAERSSLMHLTNGHPLYLSMLAAQRLSTLKPVNQILDEVEASRSDVPAMILRSTYRLLKPDQTEVIRLLAELERPEHESALEEVTGQRYNKLAKSLKRLKDLSLILERRDMSDKTLIDLHPLVRQFLRREYPKKDRDSFIGRIIIYFDKRLALVAKSLGSGSIPKNVMDVWIHKIEVLCNQADWNHAISELLKIENELARSGLGEEYARLGLKIFTGVDWLVAVDEAKDFRKLISGVCHELSYHGSHEEVQRWATHYMNAIGARGADKLNMLEFTAFDAWLQKDYGKALEFAQEAVELSKRIDVSLPSSPLHTLALALRDSGEIDRSLTIFLEGLSIEEALAQDNGKSSEFFGNIGRCYYLKEDFTTALKFYKRCGQDMAVRPRDKHNTGWLRLWVGETLCKIGRVSEGYTFLCAAKHMWSQASKLLEISADRAISDLHKNHPEIDSTLVPEWQAEKIFNAWVAQA